MSAINYTHGKRMQIIINEFSLSKKKKKKKKQNPERATAVPIFKFLKMLLKEQFAN